MNLTTASQPPRTAGQVMTLRQYAQSRRRGIAARHDVPLSTVLAEFPDQWFRRDWWDQMKATVGAGTLPDTRWWRGLDQWEREALLRTTAALRDRDFERDLRAMSHTHADSGPCQEGPVTRDPSAVTCPSCRPQEPRI